MSSLIRTAGTVELLQHGAIWIADITAVYFLKLLLVQTCSATQEADDYGMTTSNSRKLYLGCPSTSIPCPQVLGYTLGKTLGSGKFKAAWSPCERRMVRSTDEIFMYCISLLLLFCYRFYLDCHQSSEQDQEDVKKFLPWEISNLQKVSHPNIISTFKLWKQSATLSLH